MPDSDNKNFAITASKNSHSIIKQLCDDPIRRGPKTVHDPDIIGPDIVARLCDGESLQQVCIDPAMPSIRTVNRWMSADSDFADAVRNARQIGSNALMDAAVNIAAGGVHSTGSIERDKLLCSVLKWVVSKRDPDHIKFEHGSVFINIGADEADW